MCAEALGLHIKSPQRVKKTQTQHFLKPCPHAHKLHTKELASINLNAFNTQVRSKTVTLKQQSLLFCVTRCPTKCLRE